MKKTMTAFTAGWIYSFVHFSVEVACFYFLFSRISSSPLWWALAMLFDALAFLPQSVFGILSDKYPNVPYGFIGCVMILAALIIPLDVFALIILGVGNALAHVDGAQHTLRNNKAKMTPNAIFVGGGSFGVITGQLLGALGVKALLVVPALLIILSATAAFAVTRLHDTDIENGKEHIPLTITREMPDLLLVLLMLLAVATRSYVAYAIPIAWKKTTAEAIALFSFMGVGKALGGVFADKIGFRKTTYLSLLVALPFLLFGNSIMPLSLVGITMYSMTMPITVGILVSKFPKSPGFAFGITTVGLFLGLLPEFFIDLPNLLANQIAVVVLCVTALGSILLCLKRRIKNV